MHMAASGTTICYDVFTAVSDEAEAKAQEAKKSGNIKQYQSLSFSNSDTDLFRDPRWGRGQRPMVEILLFASWRGLGGGEVAEGRPKWQAFACAGNISVVILLLMLLSM